MIETLQVGNAPDNKLTVTMRGTADEVVKALAFGLPIEDLQALKDALDAELTKRASKR